MGSQRAGFTTAMLTGVSFAAVLAGAGCGGETPASTEGTGMSAATTPAATGGAGKAAPANMPATAGSGGSKTPAGMVPAGMAKPAGGNAANMPGMNTAAGTTGAAMAAAAGAGGTTATASNAGSAATAGTMASGSAGASGSTSAGAAGSDAMPVDMSGAFAIRGADPTEDSANGKNMGPYSVESYTSGYMRGDFSDATMWYPTSEDAKPPFGCVAVVPGFVSPQASIRNWGPFLASNGIVAITIGVPGSDPPQSRAMSLMSALETCKGENERADSPIKGKLSVDHLGVSGWSMGGGGTLIAAANNPNLKAAVSFAAWGPNGGDKNKVPALMFEATADPLAASMSDGYYRAMSEDVPKMLFEVQGSSHNVANDPANHDGIIGKYGLSWWKVYMEGDMRYMKFLTAPPPDIVTQKFATNLK